MGTTSGSKFDLMALLAKSAAKWGGVVKYDTSSSSSPREGKRKRIGGADSSEETFREKKKSKCKEKHKTKEPLSESQNVSFNPGSVGSSSKIVDIKTTVKNNDHKDDKQLVRKHKKLKDNSKYRQRIKGDGTLSEIQCQMETNNKEPTEENENAEFKEKLSKDVNAPTYRGKGVDLINTIKRETDSDNVIMKLLKKSQLKMESMEKLNSEYVEHKEEVLKQRNVELVNRNEGDGNLFEMQSQKPKVKKEPIEAKDENTEFKKEISTDVNYHHAPGPVCERHSKELLDIKGEDDSGNAMIMKILKKSVLKIGKLSNGKEKKKCNMKTVRKDALAVKTETVKSENMDCYTNEKLQLDKNADARWREGNSEGNGNGKKIIISRKRQRNRQFTKGEDDQILDAIETYGDNVNIVKLTEKLGRPYGSVASRIRKLKMGERSRKLKKMFSLQEDQMILDKVLPNLDGKLKDLVFPYNHQAMQELATSLDRNAININNRWATLLQPWILQYHHGTLNFDIRRMLLNYLAESYECKDDIDWPLVAERPEFVGHTESSLRYIFFQCCYLVKDHENLTHLNNSEVTLRQLAEGANNSFCEENCAKMLKKVLTRQKQVIDYFEKSLRYEFFVTSLLNSHPRPVSSVRG